jgi:hypothetical protein
MGIGADFGHHCLFYVGLQSRLQRRPALHKGRLPHVIFVYHRYASRHGW